MSVYPENFDDRALDYNDTDTQPMTPVTDCFEPVWRECRWAGQTLQYVVHETHDGVFIVSDLVYSASGYSLTDAACKWIDKRAAVEGLPSSDDIRREWQAAFSRYMCDGNLPEDRDTMNAIEADYTTRWER